MSLKILTNFRKIKFPFWFLILNNIFFFLAASSFSDFLYILPNFVAISISLCSSSFNTTFKTRLRFDDLFRTQKNFASSMKAFSKQTCLTCRRFDETSRVCKLISFPWNFINYFYPNNKISIKTYLVVYFTKFMNRKALLWLQLRILLS